MKTRNLITGIVLLVIGAFYVLMPHSLHISSGIGFGLSHGIHVSIGVIVLIVGVIVLWKKK